MLLANTALAQSCSRNTDCGSSRICIDGLCAYPDPGDTTRTDLSEDNTEGNDDTDLSSVKLEGDGSADAHVAIHVNALGLFQFGLAPTLEIGGRNFSVQARVRFLNTGLLSYIAVADAFDDEVFNFGLGIGASLRGYFFGDGNMRGLYVGGGAEYITTTVTDEFIDEAEYSTNSIAPLAEAGYRWVFGRFILEPGVIGGAAVPISSTDVPVGFTGCTFEDSCLEERETFFYGLLRLSIGFVL